MTREELCTIAEKIQTDKNPVTMTKRAFVNALGFEKRTSGNVIQINNFLDKRSLVTVPDYHDGSIDDVMELRFKYEIKSDNFQLYSLHIDKYKNLISLDIDFQSTKNYCCLIGLNGSGKSNVIEAISSIFFSLYHIATLKDGSKKYPCEFRYKVSYILNSNYVEIEDGRLRNGNKLTTDILPKNIILSYSGEDTRLWRKCYKPIYEKYCNKLTSTPGFIPPFMFNISKYQWELSLLVLLYSEDVDVLNFVNQISQGKLCKISFEYKTSNIKKWEGQDTEALIEKLRERSVYTIEEFRNTISDISFIDQSSTLFYYLYKCSIESESQVITKINIEFSDRGNIDGLSEGEKKLIIANVMIHILSSKDSLCMFDEPDSHIHITRKTELLKLIDTDNRYNLVTTHSPIFVDIMRNENVRHIINGKIDISNKVEQISALSGGYVNYFDGAFILAAPFTIIVEGTYDIKYIKKAICIHSNINAKYRQLDQVAFIPMGSAGNTESFFNDVIVNLLPNAKKIIYLFDYDKAGAEGYKKVTTLKTTYQKLEPVFYQEDYSSAYVANSNISSPYFVEDLFDKSVYDDIILDIHSKVKYREYKSINRSTSERIKNKIECGFNSFSEDKFNGFVPLLDKLLELLNT
ncbi:hypothetical protein [Bacteroides sedimenti]|uniref:AAA family ATPase n=1 Tax=Bacteroides sedimenti TaxID=2136147 RepID=A0ABM8IB28_9BACE